MADSIDHTDPDARLREVLDDLREDPDALIAIILQQARHIRELTARVDELEQTVAQQRAEIDRLRAERDEARKEGKRQAAPFRRERRSKHPGSPGRAQGHEASYRPEPERIDRRVEVRMEGCPECGDRVREVRPIRQVVEELPPLEPVAIELTTYRGHCPACGTVETTHPLKTTPATGAAGTSLGPRAQAIALLLRERHGLTMRRTTEVLDEAFGVALSPGGLAQMVQRCASRLEAEEKRLLEAARASDVQHADETSWWVAHPGEASEKPLWWLWVFADEEQTVYRVEPRRDRAVIQRMLGAEYEGVLVSDCLASYDDATPVQHKCYAHHLKAIAAATTDREATGEATGEATAGEPSAYLQAVRGLLIGAQGLKKAQPDLADKQVQAHRDALEQKADRLLASDRADALTEQEDKIRRRLKKQRDHLFVFLDHEAVPSTNNRAERQLRPAVIRRKLSCGNRTPRGAEAFERMASVVETCVQQGRSVVDYLMATMSLGIEPLPLR
jgi:uncharacterized small protein (DUF1192 family)